MFTDLFEDSDEFSIAIFKFDEMHVKGFLDPDRTKFENVNHYRFYLGEYMAIIKVSNLSNPNCFKNIYIKKNENVICSLRDFEHSTEYAVMLSTAKKSYKNSQK